MNLARRAVRLYPRTDYNRETVNHLRREWIRKVSELGDKWIVAPANRIQRHADKAVMLACVVSAFPWEWLA
jgi:hypothetical protein